MNEFNRYREEEQELKQTEKKKRCKEKSKNNQGELNHETTQVIDDGCMCDETVCDDEKEKLLNEIANLNDLLLRNRAELENFKRRTTEERIRDRKYALQDFFLDFVNITDIFDKAVNITTDDDKLQKFLTGFIMINNQLQQVLEDNGVKKINAKDQKFDPAYHSALETVYVEGVEAGIVVEEVITGYLYKDRVLRPSLVNVSTAGPKEEKQTNEEEINNE